MTNRFSLLTIAPIIGGLTLAACTASEKSVDDTASAGETERHKSGQGKRKNGEKPIRGK